jgi:hypothetical protein
MSTEFSSIESEELSSVAGGCNCRNNNNASAAAWSRFGNNNRNGWSPFGYGSYASAGRNASAFGGWNGFNGYQRPWRDSQQQQFRGMQFGGSSCSRSRR